MTNKKQQGLMTVTNSSDTPILNSLRSRFSPQKPQSLEERLAQLNDVELQWLLSNASMLQALMYMRTKMGDYSQDYISMYKSMYPKDMNFKRQKLLHDFLDEVAPLDWEPQPTTNTVQNAGTEYEPWLMRDETPDPEPETQQQYSDSFLDKLIESESSGRSDAEITIADGRRFVGKLQFGQARLQDYMDATGSSFTQDEFKADEALQDKVAAWHFRDIDKAIDALGEEAADYDRDALHAVAHLGGKSGMRSFVKSKGQYNPSDELGTSLQSYYDKFKQEG